MPIKLTSSVIFLILANAVPIIGVLFWGWDAAAILVLYWLESVIMGVLNIPKILACRKTEHGGVRSLGSNLFLVLFFSFHYGMFTFVHGAFLAEIPGARPIMEGLRNGGPILWTAGSFLLSHLFSMFINFFGKKEYLGRDPKKQMVSVYGRVIVMHIVILFGGFLAVRFGAPVLAVVMLIVLKTAIDLAAHKKEHRDRITTETLL